MKGVRVFPSYVQVSWRVGDVKASWIWSSSSGTHWIFLNKRAGAFEFVPRSSKDLFTQETNPTQMLAKVPSEGTLWQGRAQLRIEKRHLVRPDFLISTYVARSMIASLISYRTLVWFNSLNRTMKLWRTYLWRLAISNGDGQRAQRPCPSGRSNHKFEADMGV